MLLIPRRLTISGYRSVFREVVYDFSPGCTLVHGENGSGKTVLTADAIYWCLFGTSLRSGSVDGILNRNSTMASVTLEARLGDKDIIVQRTRSKTKRRGTTHLSVTLGDGTDLLDGVGTSLRAKQKGLEDLLGMEKGLVQQVSFYSPESSFLQMTHSERVKLLEAVLGLDWVGTLAKKVKEKLTAAEARLNELKLKKSSMEGNLSALELWENNLLSKQKEPVSTGPTKEQLQAELEKIEARLVEVEDRKQKLAVAHKEVNDCLAGAAERVRTLELEIKGLQTQCSTLQRQADVISSDGPCPTCGQDMRMTDRYNALAEIEAKKQGLEASIADRELRLEQAKRKHWEVQQSVSTVAQAITTLEAQVGMLRARRQSVEKDLTKVDTDTSSDALQRDLLECRRRIADIKQDLSSLSAESTEAGGQAARWRWWVGALGTRGFRNFLVERALPVLEERGNAYLQAMSDGRLAVSISPTTTTSKGKDVEGINVLVRNVRGVDAYEDDSAGERRLADLSLTLALFDLAMDAGGGRGLGYLVLDEGLDPLDSQNAKRALEVIADTAKRQGDRLVQVISHSDRVRSAVIGKVIRVERGPDGWTRVPGLGLGKKPKQANVPRERKELLATLWNEMVERGYRGRDRMALIQAVNPQARKLADLTTEQLKAVLIGVRG